MKADGEYEFADSFMNSIHNYILFQRHGDIMEPVLFFEPGPLLKKVMEEMPGKAVSFDKTQTGKFEEIPLTTPGWRIKLFNKFFYLRIGKPKEEERKSIIHLHTQFMTSGLYFINESDLIEYWQNPRDIFNAPEGYKLSPETEQRSRYLYGLIRSFTQGIQSALEIGCNIGRNLAFLNQHGFDVAGVDISQRALELLKEEYPSLNKAPLFCGRAQDILPNIETNAYDLVFSMATLMHLPPNTGDNFWKEILRVAKKALITIENEKSSSNRNWKRNYVEIFTKFGAIEFYSELITQKTLPLNQIQDEGKSTQVVKSALLGYTARVFIIS
ncbi:MAG: class I SAM-dependent methyltransferase [Waddliaceae bacterium]